MLQVVCLSQNFYGIRNIRFLVFIFMTIFNFKCPNISTHVRRFEKCDFKLRKCHLDLRFLLDCKKNGVIPKFLRFKLANRHLKNSHVYKKCQIRLLEEEIKSKRKRINTLEKDTQRIKEELQRTFSVLDFS